MVDKILPANALKEIYKPETLTLRCRNCNKTWTETRPKHYHVRYNKDGVFMVLNKPPYNRKYFKCPKCKNHHNIGRLAGDNKVNVKKKPVDPKNIDDEDIMD